MNRKVLKRAIELLSDPKKQEECVYVSYEQMALILEAILAEEVKEDITNKV